MSRSASLYERHRFMPEIIQCAVWLYHRFNLSARDIEDPMAERGMRRFKSAEQAQRFLGVHAAVHNLFNLGRHLISAELYRAFRQRACASWECATGA